MTPEQIADVLDDAADYIEQHGWCQNGLRDNQGRRCAIGALLAVRPRVGTVALGVSAGVALGVSAGVALINHLDFQGGVSSGITAWNDTEGRTEQEVLDAFRAAAKAQRSLT